MIVRLKEDFPQAEIDYTYHPNPMESIPPMREHHFAVALASCHRNCWLSRLKRLHTCRRALKKPKYVDCLPKKITKYDVAADDTQYAWGLHATYRLSFISLVVYHILIVASSSTFYGCWQHFYPNQVPQAGLVPTTAVALMSVFWGSTGALNGIITSKARRADEVDDQRGGTSLPIPEEHERPESHSLTQRRPHSSTMDV